MQVSHLAAIAFRGAKNDDESPKCAQALLTKSRKVSPQFTEYIEVDLVKLGAVNKGDRAYLKGQSVDPGFANSDNVGVYLVFHQSRFGYPQVFDRAIRGERYEQKGGHPEFRGQAAAGIVQVMRDVGLTRIRKLCLVVCNVAFCSKNYECSFLELLLPELKKQYKSEAPMIAGWDMPISVNSTGRKILTDQAPAPFAAPYRNEHKFTFCLNPQTGEYEQRLESEGWSDGHHRQTLLGATPALCCTCTLF